MAAAIFRPQTADYLETRLGKAPPEAAVNFVEHSHSAKVDVLMGNSFQVSDTAQEARFDFIAANSETSEQA